MVIQKDKIIPAATHRGVVEGVNPINVIRKDPESRNINENPISTGLMLEE